MLLSYVGAMVLVVLGIWILGTVLALPAVLEDNSDVKWWQPGVALNILVAFLIALAWFFKGLIWAITFLFAK